MKKKIYKKLIAIVALSSFAAMLFTACSVMGETYGPYHHEALITVPTKAVTLKDRTYCWFNDDLYEMQEGSFQFISTHKVQDKAYIGGVNDIQTDGTNLYVASSDYQNSITVFSSEFEYIKTLVAGSAQSLLLEGDFIYYFKLNESRDGVSELRCYNQATQEDIFLTDGFVNDIFTVNGKTIYANLKGNLYWADETENVNLANDYILNSWTHGKNYQTQQSLGFYFQGKTGTVAIKNEAVEVSYGGQANTYPLGQESILYNRVVVDNGKLIFGTIEYKQNDQCNNDFCICHVGESKLFSYDFESGEFAVQQTLADVYIVRRFLPFLLQ